MSPKYVQVEKETVGPSQPLCFLTLGVCSLSSHVLPLVHPSVRLLAHPMLSPAPHSIFILVSPALVTLPALSSFYTQRY